MQSDVEAKLREVTRFRANKKRLDVSRTPEGRGHQLDAVGKLTEQIDRTLGTNKVVRETFVELLIRTRLIILAFLGVIAMVISMIAR